MSAETLENDVSLLVTKITKPVTASFLREQARLLFGRARGDDVYQELTNNLEKHGIVQRKGLGLSSKLFGTLEMFQAT